MANLCRTCRAPLPPEGKRPGHPRRYCANGVCSPWGDRKARQPIGCIDCGEPFVPRRTAKRCAACIKKRKAPAVRDESKKLVGVDPTTCDREYTTDEAEFLKAMERYKREARRPFPCFSEVLRVAIALGYRRVEPAGPLPGCREGAHG